MKPVLMLMLLLVLPMLAVEVAAEDSWGQLQSLYASVDDPVVVVEEPSDRPVVRAQPSVDVDPWAGLQDFYLPFTPAEEAAALNNPAVSRQVSRQLHHSLAPFRALIDEAAARFDIPPAVIGAVIMVESSGNPRASTRTSSAKGLMQTIDSTFAEARQGLLQQNVRVSNDPFDPRSSIMAGCWYLDRMFRQMEQDRGLRCDRTDLAAWRKVAEYYYAGPTHGRKRAGVVIMYAGGRRVVVDKAGYAQKVMRWARVMS